MKLCRWLILIYMLAASACRIPLRTTPSPWIFLYSPTMGEHPVDNGFNFPSSDGVHYLVQPRRQPLSGSLSLQAAITGDATYEYGFGPDNPGRSPASVRLFIERANDDMTSDYYRWWSNPAMAVLQPGTIALTVPLSPDSWTSVYGHRATDTAESLAGFQDTLDHPAMIGMTYSGGDFFGHGVWISSGTARFQILRFSIIP